MTKISMLNNLSPKQWMSRIIYGLIILLVNYGFTQILLGLSGGAYGNFVMPFDLWSIIVVLILKPLVCAVVAVEAYEKVPWWH